MDRTRHIDELFDRHTAETGVAKRETILHRMQQLMYEHAIYAPIWQLGFLSGQGSGVEESGLGLITGYPYSAPYEDVRLKTGA
jgi:peptide/nickel transport system substrate-binding protein